MPCDESFERAVNNASLQGCCRSGLRALGNKSTAVKATTTRDIQGSVDLDGCLKQDFPSAPRWDYLIAYAHCLFCVEIHPFKVSEVLRKKQWLDGWLKSTGTPIRNWAHSVHYFWVPTSSMPSPKGWSAQYRQLSSEGIAVSRQVALQC